MIYVDQPSRSLIIHIKNAGGTCRLNYALAVLQAKCQLHVDEAIALINKMNGEGTLLVCWDMKNEEIKLGLIGRKECIKSA